jgi:hypothetical protein
MTTLPRNISPTEPSLIQAAKSRRLCTFYYADWNVASDTSSNASFHLDSETAGDRLGKLFDAAIECKLAERAAFLHDAWAGDEALRRAVEALVAQHKDADSFMESPALEVAAKARAEV